MKLSELLQGVEVLTSTAPATWDITGVAYDSREVQPGDVFVAISMLTSLSSPASATA